MTNPISRLRAIFALASAAALLAGCSTTADEASRDEHVKYAWVVLGDGGKPIARVATDYATCPNINVGDGETRMQLRAAAGTAAQRTTASASADSKPSSFPLNTCEATLPASAKLARVGTRFLPLPKAEPQRVLVLAIPAAA